MTRYIPLFIFSLFSFLCSCTSDIDQTGTEKQRVTLTLSLGCRDMVTADFLQPQADDTPAAVAEVRGNTTKGDNTTKSGSGTDLIRNAYVVMCKGGKVEHIYHVNNEDEHDFERHQVASISTETGEYTFYSFANLQFNETVEGGEVKSLVIHGVEVEPGRDPLLSVTFRVGEGLPNFRFNNKDYGNVDSMVVSCEYNGFDLVNSNGGRGVPMSNKETYTIDNNMTLVLSLYRLLAKMQMTFNNKTAQPIRVLKITTGSITKNTGETLTRPSCTYLFPPMDNNGLVTTDFNRITSHDTCSYVHYDKSADECQVIEADGTVTFPDFYINDSEATNAMKSFPLTILMQRQNAEGQWVNDERKALIQLPRIPRNSVAYVKINLTDYVLKLKAFTYAPIGGYPPFVVTQNDDFYVTFTRPGDFELRPSLYKYVDSANPEKWIDLSDKNQVADAHIDVADPNDILEVKPTLDPVTGEILGSIKKAADGTAKKGTATIRLTINIVNAKRVIQPYTRTIYVVVE